MLLCQFFVLAGNRFWFYILRYLCTGFRQDFLPRVLVDTKWIYIVRSMARARTVNGQTVEDRHQKTKSEIGLHQGIFLCRHLGNMLNTIL